MKKIALLSALGLGAALLGGCAGGLAGVEANLSSPAATQAAANVSAVANAFECFVAVGSGVALGAEQQGKTSGQTATGIIYVASAALCNIKGGTTGASVSVPQSQVVTQ